jgi:phage replication-related protein YjqB (UPF0714/DUF867 family)
MTDRHASFAELCRDMREGVDFEVRLSQGPLPVRVVAPHAGRIEPGTGSIARAIAGNLFSVCEFRGIRPSGNRRLHLTAHRFDEPRCLAAVRLAHLAVSVHGVRGTAEFVMVGGRAAGLAAMMRTALSDAGFFVRKAESGLRGTHPRNICNRGHSGRGIQLEISAELRRRLVREPERRNRFGEAVRSVLEHRFRRPASRPKAWK